MNQLEWFEHSYTDKLCLSAYTKRGRYDITDVSTGDLRDPRWYTRRMEHSLMPPFDGFCPTLEAAKRACESDFIALQRADLWLDYIRDNDPPHLTRNEEI